jgi:hypothetical protein
LVIPSPCHAPIKTNAAESGFLGFHHRGSADI